MKMDGRPLNGSKRQQEIAKRNAEIRRLHEQGASLSELGRRYGVSRQRVQTILRPRRKT